MARSLYRRVERSSAKVFLDGDGCTRQEHDLLRRAYSSKSRRTAASGGVLGRLWLAESRCFNLKAGRRLLRARAMARLLQSSLRLSLAIYGPSGQRFASTPYLASSTASSTTRGTPQWCEPSGLEVQAGDELWNWYGFAGHGAGSVEEWAQDETMFSAHTASRLGSDRPSPYRDGRCSESDVAVAKGGGGAKKSKNHLRSAHA